MSQVDKIFLEQYENFLRNLDVDNACKLLRDYYPKKLYHYMKYPTNSSNRLIWQDKIYFVDPLTFNDPLEAISNCDNIDGVMAKCAAIKDCRSEYVRGIGCIRFIGRRNIARCTCLSDNVISVPMWAHYTDNHKGICVEFDTSKFNDKNLLLLKIIYTDKFFVNKVCKDEQSLKKLICPAVFKGSAWSYENEWRLFDIDKDDLDKLGVSKKVSDAISAIYLGLNCPMDRNLLRWAKERGKKLYKMIKKPLDKSNNLISIGYEEITDIDLLLKYL